MSICRLSVLKAQFFRVGISEIGISKKKKTRSGVFIWVRLVALDGIRNGSFRDPERDVWGGMGRGVKMGRVPDARLH